MDECGRERDTVGFVFVIDRGFEGSRVQDLLDDVPRVIATNGLELIGNLLALPGCLVSCVFGHHPRYNHGDSYDTHDNGYGYGENQSP